MRILVFIGLLGAAGDAAAEVRFNLDVGGMFRQIPSVDLAKLAGIDGFGAKDDAGPAAVGLQLGFGVQIDAWEAAVEVAAGAGGLDLDAIEDRYFGMRDNLGGSSTLMAGLRLMWTPRLGEDWQLLVGPRTAWYSLGASSGLGQAQLSSLGVGGLTGFRWRSHKVTPTLDGHLQVTGDVLSQLPMFVRVRRGGDDVLLESDSPDGAFLSWGLTLSYCFTFR